LAGAFATGLPPDDEEEGTLSGRRAAPIMYLSLRGTMTMKTLCLCVSALGLSLLPCQAQQIYTLDPNNSVIRIHLDTAGALGFLGHPHLIETPIERGKFVYYPADPGKSSVELVVDAGALQVVDPKRSTKERKEIQATMQSGRVLGIADYPRIVFNSSKVEPLDHDRLQVTGNLTIRSNTHPVLLQVSLEQEGPQLKARGETQFKLTSFAIKPVAAALGTVRVQDQITISFQVFGQPKRSDGS
jgi:polyisoprenoid-binding protein YceI